ncbi:hypothetical protein V3C33_01825 [Micrococcaceae bacterium Sec5.7]
MGTQFTVNNIALRSQARSFEGLDEQLSSTTAWSADSCQSPRAAAVQVRRDGACGDAGPLTSGYTKVIEPVETSAG